ncbi:GNAT family N-acetyltransferase [Halorussus lipolyticus]|uniref:GNAT family N-acetyltransferase n=1 Tax=Halorussus lipolyticus TaxID=3034024 RepID=UPI0023E77686|nr:GNAT family N-acetyltransferase [Halorussus sp. DT80]
MIRPAEPADRETLREVQTHLREPNPPLLDYAIEGPPLTLVTTAPDDTPVGYLVAFYDDEAGYVAELVVAPDYRREGRARRLLGGAFDRLRDAGCSRIRLAVHPDNDAARTLYESLGFADVGREEDHYDDGREAIVMTRDL